MTVFVAAVGDANDPSTWSGIPYHFTKAGQEAGLIDAGLPLSTTGPSWKAQRAVWNGLQLASRGTYGGFQFSERFLNRLWRQAPPLAAGDSVINLFPLFPQHIVSDERVAKWFFIDQTDTPFTVGSWSVEISVDGSPLSSPVAFQIVSN